MASALTSGASARSARRRVESKAPIVRPLLGRRDPDLFRGQPLAALRRARNEKKTLGMRVKLPMAEEHGGGHVPRCVSRLAVQAKHWHS